MRGQTASGYENTMGGGRRGENLHPGDAAQEENEEAQGLENVIRSINNQKIQCMSQQENDLRALAKIMDFLRAVSIILVVMNVYRFCYEAIRLWEWHRRDGQNPDEIQPHGGTVPFHPIHETVCRPPTCLSCLRTKGVKGEKITWGRIWTALAAGFVLFFLNWWG